MTTEEKNNELLSMVIKLERELRCAVIAYVPAEVQAPYRKVMQEARKSIIKNDPFADQSCYLDRVRQIASKM